MLAMVCAIQLTGVAAADVQLADPTDSEITLNLNGSRNVSVKWDGESGPCILDGDDNFTLAVVVDPASVVGTAPTVSGTPLVFDDATDCAGVDFTVEGGTAIGSATFNVFVATLACNDCDPSAGWTQLFESATGGSTLFTVTVTVIDPTIDGPVDAAGIANAYLKDRENSDCMGKWGSNKTKSNWHGQLISHIAQHFSGQAVTGAQIAAYIEAACLP